MAATLDLATGCALALTSITDGIATGRTGAQVLCTGMFTTGPAEGATVIAIAASTDRAIMEPTGSTKYILTAGALTQTVVTNKMAVPIQHDGAQRIGARVTGRPGEFAIVQVAHHLHRGIGPAVGKLQFGNGMGNFHDSISK